MTTNWGGNVTYTAADLAYPTSIGAVCDLVRRSRRVKTLGSRHSFNKIADTDGVQISLDALPADIEIDEARRAVSVAGGVRYGDLAARLHRQGLALTNLASLPHITVAGACATGTHGSGSAQPALSESVRSIDLVTAGGELLHVDRSDPDFAGMVVNLGLLGIVVRLTLDVVPSFEVRQRVFLDLPGTTARESFEEIMGSGYSVSLMTDWSTDSFSRLWVKSTGRESFGADSFGDEAFGARAATEAVHPVVGADAAGCTEQLGVAGPWHTRLPHFRLDFTPSSGREIQTEYLLPRRHAADALSALGRLGPRISDLLFVSEVRTVAADSQWMSAAYGRDSAAFHLTWKPDTAAVNAVLPALDDALRQFGARPHPGKAFHVRPGMTAELYPHSADFQDLRARLDPDGKFHNAFSDSYFAAADTATA